jgi:hypothetical protein
MSLIKLFETENCVTMKKEMSGDVVDFNIAPTKLSLF